jgi:hypothetical protein
MPTPPALAALADLQEGRTFSAPFYDSRSAQVGNRSTAKGWIVRERYVYRDRDGELSVQFIRHPFYDESDATAWREERVWSAN